MEKSPLKFSMFYLQTEYRVLYLFHIRLSETAKLSHYLCAYYWRCDAFG